MSGAVRLVICFVALPLCVGLLAFAGQFYVTYVLHDQLVMDFSWVLGPVILSYIPGLFLYLLLLLISALLSQRK